MQKEWECGCHTADEVELNWSRAAKLLRAFFCRGTNLHKAFDVAVMTKLADGDTGKTHGKIDEIDNQ